MQHDDIDHCTAENVWEKRQKTLSNQQQANRLMFVLQKKTSQTCDLVQQKFISLTKNVMSCQNMGFFFFLLHMAHRHMPLWKRYFPTVQFPGANGLCLPWSKKKKKKKENRRVCLSCRTGHHTRKKTSLPVPAQRFGKTLAEDNWFHFVSVQFDSVYSSWI